MNEIDEMDIHWYFEVMNREESKEERFIDEIW